MRRGRYGGLLRGEVPRERFDALSCKSDEAYQLLEQAPAGSWERLTAWNAFLCQIYADNLLDAEGSATIPSDTARIATELYALAAAWLERAALLRADPQRRLEIDPRAPLPHFRTALRSTEQLSGMRTTLEDAHVRVAVELGRFSGAPTAQRTLADRLARIDSYRQRVALLWLGREADAMRGAIGDALSDGLAGVSELGQLLVRPDLLGT